MNEENPLRQALIQAEFPIRHVDSLWEKNLWCCDPYTKACQDIRLGIGFLTAMIGARSKGKTTMATAIGMEVIRKGTTCLYTSAVGFFMAIRSSYTKNSGVTELEVFNDFRAPRFLVIDEIDKRPDKDWEKTLLFELIDRRYGDKKDTLLIANQTVEEFTAMLGPSIISRINRSGHLIVCDWPPFEKEDA